MARKKELPERHVRMADGTILDAEAGLAGPSLWIWWNDGTSIATAARIAGNPGKTATLTAVLPGSEQVWEGYTRCVLVKVDASGRTCARMQREE